MSRIKISIEGTLDLGIYGDTEEEQMEGVNLELNEAYVDLIDALIDVEVKVEKIS